MSSNIDALKAEYALKGLHQSSKPEKTVYILGKKCQQIKFVSSDSKLNIFKRAGCALLGAATLPFSLAVKDLRNATFGKALRGRIEEKVLHNAVDPLEEKEEKLRTTPSDPSNENSPSKLLVQKGYDRKNRKTVVDYAKYLKQTGYEFVDDKNGNLIYPDPEGSSMIFIPGGKFEDARSVRMNNPETGEPLKGNAFEKGMLKYHDVYEKREQAIAKEIEKRCKGLSGQKLKDKEKEIRSEFHTAVLTDDGVNFCYKADPNDRTLFGKQAYKVRHKIELDKSAKNNLTSINDKANLKINRAKAPKNPYSTQSTEPQPSNSPRSSAIEEVHEKEKTENATPPPTRIEELVDVD